jgi:AcrR family transcriptional regulator
VYLVKRVTLPKQQQKEQTRARLIEAALEVFALHGYERATVEEVAVAAGHSKGAYYFHFSTKEEILLELLAVWTADQDRRLKAFDSQTAPAAALLETLESFLSYADRDRRWPPLLVEFWTQAQRSDRVRKSLGKAYASWRREVAKVFSRAVEAGVISPALEVDEAARIMLAAHDGLVVEQCVGGEPGKAASLRKVLGTLLASLLASAEGPDGHGPDASRGARLERSRRRL